MEKKEVGNLSGNYKEFAGQRCKNMFTTQQTLLARLATWTTLHFANTLELEKYVGVKEKLTR